MHVTVPLFILRATVPAEIHEPPVVPGGVPVVDDTTGAVVVDDTTGEAIVIDDTL